MKLKGCIVQAPPRALHVMMGQPIIQARMYMFICCNSHVYVKSSLLKEFVISNWGKTMKHSFDVKKKNLKEDSKTLVNCNSTLVN